MKKYFTKYKPFLLFLSHFFSTYILLAFCYKLYLSCYPNMPDPVTKQVAKATHFILLFTDDQSQLLEDANATVVDVVYNNKKIGRITEGCNAVSVLILFVSFVVAFSGKRSTTIWFCLVGCVLIYGLNIFRIVFLCQLIEAFPEKEALLHGVFFPLCIYGLVFVLWLVWVNRFSRYAK